MSAIRGRGIGSSASSIGRAGSADAIAIGARFRGHNRAGDYTWHADCEVTVADPGRTFEFAVPPDFEHLTTWRYDIEETDGKRELVLKEIAKGETVESLREKTDAEFRVADNLIEM